MICNKCNHKLPDDSEFCQYCGSKIENAEVVDTFTPDTTELIEELNNPDITSDDALSAILKFEAKTTIGTMEANVNSQPDNESDEDFGLVSEKPIFTLALKSVDGEEEYLDKLRTTGGERIKYTRRGSTSAAGINGMIDIYDTFLPSGQPYKTIYINMYGAKASISAPQGFTFAKKVVTAPVAEMSKATTSKRFCSHCGNLIDEESKICTGCGKQYFKGIRYYLVSIFAKKHIPSIIISSLLVISLIANAIMAYNLTKSREIYDNSHNIDKSLYTVCTVEELYKNPQKYNHTQVAVTSWKVISQYRENTVVGTFYDFLLCNDLTHYTDKSDYPISPVYRYYKDCIQPFNTPYIGVIVYSDFVYANISPQKNKITVYGTFTYNPTISEGSRYIGDSHTYNIYATYYE